MPNYANGKIYQIISPNYPLPYIGSTTTRLCKRMAGHREAKNRCMSRIIIDAGDAYIELIEEFPCENKEQLNKREGEIIREKKCVNRQVAGRTNKEWYEEHRSQQCARRKASHDTNREASRAQMKTWYETNKDTYNAKRREAWAKKKAQQSVECITTPSVADELTSSIRPDPSTSQVADSSLA